MQNNLFIGPDADVRFALNSLRACEAAGTIAEEKTTILDGITLAHGPNGRLRGKYRSGADNMLALSLACSSRSLPEWQCLTITLGAMDLTDAAVIGIVARTSSPKSTVSRAIIRSGRDGDFVDQSFNKALVSYAAPSTHLDVIEITKAANLPLQAQWRDMILFFRPGPVEIDILDLRVFVV